MSTKARLRVGAQRDLELMPQDEVLERHIPARPNGSSEGAESQEEQLEHPSD